MNDVFRTQGPGHPVHYPELLPENTVFEAGDDASFEYCEERRTVRAWLEQILISALIFLALLLGLGVFGLTEQRREALSIVHASPLGQQALPDLLVRRCDNDSFYTDRMC
jgi:hypothetical protein